MAIDTSAVPLPSFDFGLIGMFLIIFFVVLIVGLAFGTAIFLFLRAKKFKYSIHVFAKINNRFQKMLVDKGRILKINPFGDKVLFLKKSKRHLPFPNLQMGKNEFWYCLRGDGELINIDIEDIDEKAKRMNLHFVDTDMRMARIGLERHFNEIFKKMPDWKKILVGVGIFVFAFILVMSNIIMFTQFGKLAEKFDASAESVNNLAQSTEQVAKGLISVLSYVEGKNPDYFNYQKNSTSGLIKV